MLFKRHAFSLFMRYLKSRSQTALEYLFLVAGALLFVLFVVLILRGGILPRTTNKISEDVKSYFDKHARYYLFFENFDTGTSYRWENDTEGWSVQNGVYVSPNSGKSVVGLTLSNFSYTAFVDTSDFGTGGLVFRYRNRTNYYDVYVQDSPKTVYLRRIINGGGPAWTSKPITAEPRKGLYLRVDANGTNITVYVNNVAFISEIDSTANPDLEGRVGVEAIAGSTKFDDVGIFSCVGQCGT